MNLTYIYNDVLKCFSSITLNQPRTNNRAGAEFGLECLIPLFGLLLIICGKVRRLETMTSINLESGAEPPIRYM